MDGWMDYQGHDNALLLFSNNDDGNESQVARRLTGGRGGDTTYKDDPKS